MIYINPFANIAWKLQAGKVAHLWLQIQTAYQNPWQFTDISSHYASSNMEILFKNFKPRNILCRNKSVFVSVAKDKWSKVDVQFTELQLFQALLCLVDDRSKSFHHNLPPRSCTACHEDFRYSSLITSRLIHIIIVFFINSSNKEFSAKTVSWHNFFFCQGTLDITCLYVTNVTTI